MRSVQQPNCFVMTACFTKFVSQAVVTTPFGCSAYYISCWQLVDAPGHAMLLSGSIADGLVRECRLWCSPPHFSCQSMHQNRSPLSKQCFLCKPNRHLLAAVHGGKCCSSLLMQLSTSEHSCSTVLVCWDFRISWPCFEALSLRAIQVRSHILCKIGAT